MSRRFRFVGMTALLCMTVAAAGIAVNTVPSPPAFADPPGDQTYTGTKRCAQCHLDQFTKWKATSHSRAFALLTEKYEKDPKCLKCHTTGYGEKTGYGAVNDDSLKDVGCEVCHGPGSKHEEVAKTFAEVKNLTEEQEALIRGTIWEMLPKNVCVECHEIQGHGDSKTPAELKRRKKKS